jgi:hypothetical protein
MGELQNNASCRVQPESCAAAAHLLRPNASRQIDLEYEDAVSAKMCPIISTQVLANIGSWFTNHGYPVSTTMSNSGIPVFPTSAPLVGLDSEAWHANAQPVPINVLDAVPHDLGFVQSMTHYLSSRGHAANLSPSISQNDCGLVRMNHGDFGYEYIQSTPFSPSSHGPATYQPPAPLHQKQPRSKIRPRCFEHGCEGRTFSCRENYRRHLREKNGSSLVVCTICGLFFSRKSNRDKHVLDGKCKILIETFANTADETAIQAVTSLALVGVVECVSAAEKNCPGL